jgi:hypothetical protein
LITTQTHSDLFGRMCGVPDNSILFNFWRNTGVPEFLQVNFIPLSCVTNQIVVANVDGAPIILLNLSQMEKHKEVCSKNG